MGGIPIGAAALTIIASNMESLVKGETVVTETCGKNCHAIVAPPVLVLCAGEGRHNGLSVVECLNMVLKLKDLSACCTPTR